MADQANSHSTAVQGADIQGINVDKVSVWLTANIDGAQAPYSFSLIAGGRSNLTYKVTDANKVGYVLRRPPLGHVLATAHDMAREHRIIAAVGKTGVPVPKTLGVCTDEGVNGAPFYVMAFVEGEVLDSAEKAAKLDPSLRIAASMNLIDVLAELHAVDVDAVGLGDLAKKIRNRKSTSRNSSPTTLAQPESLRRKATQRPDKDQRLSDET